jgi:hypothetical protein
VTKTKNRTPEAHARLIIQHETEMIQPEKLATLNWIADLVRPHVNAERLFRAASAAFEVAIPEDEIPAADAVYVSALVLLG